MQSFTSGITGDNHYIISMEDYLEKDIPTAWKLSKGYHGLDDDAEIDINDYEEKYLTVKWWDMYFIQLSMITKYVEVNQLGYLKF